MISEFLCNLSITTKHRKKCIDFFLGRDFVSGLFCTLKSKKKFKTLKTEELFQNLKVFQHCTLCPKNVPLCDCLYLRQILTDFQNFFYRYIL